MSSHPKHHAGTRLHNDHVIYGVAFATALFAAGLVLFELFFAQALPGPALTDGALSAAQSKAIDTILDTAKTFTEWAVAVIGATAFFLKIGSDKDIKISRTDLAFASGIFLLCITSIAFWQMAMSLTADLLTVDQSPLTNDRWRRLFAYQYISGLAAICLFAVYVFQSFWMRIRNLT